MTRPNPLAVLLALAPTASLAGDPVEFNRDIRPILSENCFLCHGPDKTDRKAGLRLDIRDLALAKEAFVPGDAEASELVTRVLSNDPDEVMPPPESTKVLTPAQKDLLKRWVAEGAKYQAHWAYEPIRRPAVPNVKDPSWVKNPVDAFILAHLEARGLKPSREADRRTLIRRLSLDLIGLPPTVEEVRAFEADTSPDAYEKLVDRLLASPHYGERMAVPWLDLARFADTVGYHGDQNQHIFPYRDYVIDAFNRNLPFDRFTVEQLAGDLLPDATPEQRVASGFNRLNMMTREGGAQPKEYLAKYAGDRVRTVAITWLGSTMGCAECHDHKFDPFTSRDFYRMAAFFADVKQWGVYADYGYTPNPDLRGVGNEHPFPPEIEVESPYLKRRIAKLDGQIRDLLARNPAGRDEWLASTRAFLDREPTGWETPKASVEEEPGKEGPVLEARADGASYVTGKTQAKQSATILLEPRPGRISSIRLELLARDGRAGKDVKGASNTPIKFVASLKSAGSGEPAKLKMAHAEADHFNPRYSNGDPIEDVKDGWRVDGRRLDSPQSAVYHLERPIQVAEGDQLVILLVKGDGIGTIRLGVSPIASLSPFDPVVPRPLVEAIQAEPGSRTPEQTALVNAAHGIGPGSKREVLAEYQRLARELRECRGGKAFSMVTEAREPLPTRVLPRGNWQDESGELLAPGVPGFLPQPPEADSRRLNRLDLARWLTSPENPLTPRVFANRLWKQFFGTGLSAVMEDVGAQGEWPSHPDLLDWLALEFRDGGWDVKALVRRMVTSNAYRQDARLRPELREADPANRLLASQNPRRLEAEFVRDNALAVAGLINLEMGGPSVKPYQPAGYYAILQFPDRDYDADLDDRQYRRGLYAHWQRTFLQPMLANFDAPPREECTASRVVANTPQQALTLLNDPTFVEAARVLASSILEGPARSDEARLDLLFEKAIARPAKPKERASLIAFLANQRREARDHPEEAAKLLATGIAPPSNVADKPELAAWAEVCRVVLNLHETITRY